MELRTLALPQFQLVEGYSSQAARAGTPQPGIYEGQVWGPVFQEMDQVIESAVTHPGIVLQPCRGEREGKR